jgi:flavin-dependent dehydrogenase
VIIVGASLAGAAAAIELGRRGVSVLLVDKATFPRRKACGEGLSARGRSELERLGISSAELLSIGCEVDGYHIEHRGTVVEVADSGGGLGVPREKIDDLVLRQALGCQGVSLQSGAVLSSVTRHRGHFEVAWAGGAAKSEFLIIADGGRSWSARALGLSAPIIAKPRYGTSSSWRITGGSLRPFVTVVLVKGGEVYITPLLDGRCNVSVLGIKDLVQRASHIDYIRNLLGCSPLLSGLTWQPIGMPLGAGPLNSGYRASEIDGAFLVGDACETLDPCGGFGMTHALISGRIAGECVERALGGASVAEELRRYALEREKAARDMRGFTRMTVVMMGSAMGRAVLPTAARLGVLSLVSQAAHAPSRGSLVERILRCFG